MHILLLPPCVAAPANAILLPTACLVCAARRAVLAARSSPKRLYHHCARRVSLHVRPAAAACTRRSAARLLRSHICTHSFLLRFSHYHLPFSARGVLRSARSHHRCADWFPPLPLYLCVLFYFALQCLHHWDSACHLHYLPPHRGLPATSDTCYTCLTYMHFCTTHFHTTHHAAPVLPAATCTLLPAPFCTCACHNHLPAFHGFWFNSACYTAILLPFCSLFSISGSFVRLFVSLLPPPATASGLIRTKASHLRSLPGFVTDCLPFLGPFLHTCHCTAHCTALRYCSTCRCTHSYYCVDVYDGFITTTPSHTYRTVSFDFSTLCATPFTALPRHHTHARHYNRLFCLPYSLFTVCSARFCYLPATALLPLPPLLPPACTPHRIFSLPAHLPAACTLLAFMYFLLLPLHLTYRTHRLPLFTMPFPRATCCICTFTFDFFLHHYCCSCAHFSCRFTTGLRTGRFSWWGSPHCFHLLRSLHARTAAACRRQFLPLPGFAAKHCMGPSFYRRYLPAFHTTHRLFWLCTPCLLLPPY